MKRLALAFTVFFAVFIALVVTPASAQQSRAQLSEQNNKTITTNGRGAITGQVMNGMIEAVIGASGLQNDANTWYQSNSFNGDTLLGSHVTFGHLGCNGGLDGAVDVSAKLNANLAAFAQATGGPGTYYVADGSACLISAHQIFVPPYIALQCTDSLPTIIPQEVANIGRKTCDFGGNTSGQSAFKLGYGASVKGIRLVNPHIDWSSVTTPRQQLQAVNSFAGTGFYAPPDNVPLNGGQNAQLDNVAIVGFNLCASFQTINPNAANIRGDCTNGFTVAAVHDVGNFSNVFFEPFATVSQSFSSPSFNIIGVADNGSGVAQFTISGIVDLQFNDVVNTQNVPGRPDLLGRFKIIAVSQSGGNTLVTIGDPATGAGVQYGPLTVTGNTASKSVPPADNSFFVTNLVGLPTTKACQTVAACYTITDSASAIPDNTTITWFNVDYAVGLINRQATSTQTADIFTLTPGTYAGTCGVSVTCKITLDTNWRHGVGFTCGDPALSQGIFYTNTFVNWYDTAYLFKNGCSFQVLDGCNADSSEPGDPTTIGVDIQGTSMWHQMLKCGFQSIGTAVRGQSTYFNLQDPVLTWTGPNITSAILLAEFGAGHYSVGFSSNNGTAPIFVGDTGGANETSVEWQGFIPLAGIQFKSFAAQALFGNPRVLYAQQIGVGNGTYNPRYNIDNVTGTSGTVGESISASTAASGFGDTNIQTTDIGWIANRHTGSNTPIYRNGTTAGTWGASLTAGAFCDQANGVTTFCHLRNGMFYYGQQFTIAQLLAVTCDSTIAGINMLVHDTVSAAAPAFGAAVAGGGSTNTNDAKAHCDSFTGTWKWSS